MSRVAYTVNRTTTPPPLSADFDGAAWQQAEYGEVAQFRPESTAHRPLVRFRLLHDDHNLYLRFQVNDRYVRSLNTEYMAPVCHDSCTEFFVRPRPDKGYFNFEVNAGGALHLSYIEDETRTPHGFKRFQPVASEWAHQIAIWHSLPSIVDPEITTAVTWGNGWIIPIALLEAYTGALGELGGHEWRANFYKCGDKTSHPHWASWSPVTALNFHLPACFGTLRLA